MKKEEKELKELGKMADNLHDHLLPYKIMRLTFGHTYTGLSELLCF